MKRLNEQRLQAFHLGSMGIQAKYRKEIEDQQKNKKEQRLANEYNEFVGTFQGAPTASSRGWERSKAYDSSSRGYDDRDLRNRYSPSTSSDVWERAGTCDVYRGYNGRDMENLYTPTSSMSCERTGTYKIDSRRLDYRDLGNQYIPTASSDAWERGGTYDSSSRRCEDRFPGNEYSPTSSNAWERAGTYDDSSRRFDDRDSKNLHTPENRTVTENLQLKKDKKDKVTAPQSHKAHRGEITLYKNNLRRAKFYLEKSRQNRMQGLPQTEELAKADARWQKVIDDEEARVKDNLTIREFIQSKKQSLASTSSKRDRSIDDKEDRDMGDSYKPTSSNVWERAGTYDDDSRRFDDRDSKNLHTPEFGTATETLQLYTDKKHELTAPQYHQSLSAEITAYKNNLRRAKFYLEKSRQNRMQGLPQTEQLAKADARWQKVMDDEESRAKDNLTIREFIQSKKQSLASTSSKGDRSIDDKEDRDMGDSYTPSSSRGWERTGTYNNDSIRSDYRDLENHYTPTASSDAWERGDTYNRSSRRYNDHDLGNEYTPTSSNAWERAGTYDDGLRKYDGRKSGNLYIPENRTIAENLQLKKDKKDKVTAPQSHKAHRGEITLYKNNLRRAKFYLEKSRQNRMQGLPQTEELAKADARWQKVIDDEEARVKDNLTIREFIQSKKQSLASTSSKRDRSIDDKEDRDMGDSYKPTSSNVWERAGTYDDDSRRFDDRDSKNLHTPEFGTATETLQLYTDKKHELTAPQYHQSLSAEITAYKNNLRRAKFYLEKSRQNRMQGLPQTEQLAKADARWQKVMDDEESRAKDNLTIREFIQSKKQSLASTSSKGDRSIDDKEDRDMGDSYTPSSSRGWERTGTYNNDSIRSDYRDLENHYTLTPSSDNSSRRDDDRDMGDSYTPTSSNVWERAGTYDDDSRRFDDRDSKNLHTPEIGTATETLPLYTDKKHELTAPQYHQTLSAEITAYKNNLRRAKFFLEKSIQKRMQNLPQTGKLAKADARFQKVMDREEKRLKDNLTIREFLQREKQSLAYTTLKRGGSMDDIVEPKVKKANNSSTTSQNKNQRRSVTDSTSKLQSIDFKSDSNSVCLNPDTINNPSPGASGVNKGSRSRARFSQNMKIDVTNIDKRTYFSDDAKSHLKVSIVDAGSPNFKMSVENFSQVEYAVQKVMWNRICEGKQAVFLGSTMEERYRGFRIISCENEEMLKLIKDTVAGLGELWPGCNIQVKHLHELPKNPTIKLNLPIPNMKEPKMVLGLLMANNPQLPVHRWNLVQFGRSFDGRIPVVFRVDGETIKLLAQMNNKVTFCMRSVTVCIRKTDSEEPENAVSMETIQNDAGSIDFSNLFNEDLELVNDKRPENIEI